MSAFHGNHKEDRRVSLDSRFTSTSIVREANLRVEVVFDIDLWYSSSHNPVGSRQHLSLRCPDLRHTNRERKI